MHEWICHNSLLAERQAGNSRSSMSFSSFPLEVNPHLDARERRGCSILDPRKLYNPRDFKGRSTGFPAHDRKVEPATGSRVPTGYSHRGDAMNYLVNAPCLCSVRSAILLLFLFMVMVTFSAGPASAQTGYTGIFGGGPLYINATNNIAEIENSGYTEVI